MKSFFIWHYRLLPFARRTCGFSYAKVSPATEGTIIIFCIKMYFLAVVMMNVQFVGLSLIIRCFVEVKVTNIGAFRKMNEAQYLK